MCYYAVITCRSLAWFLLTIVADLFILTAMESPKWLVGPQSYIIDDSMAENTTIQRYPSVGINTRCILMKNVNAVNFNCGPFDLDGFATENNVYPLPWKFARFFIVLGFIIMTLTLILTLATFCRQSIFGKSIHTITGSAQAFAAICVLIALFLHPFAWGHDRVKRLCGSESSAYWPSDCSLGWSLYCAIISVIFGFVCASMSIKAESANMNINVKRRIEAGERLLCVM
ncbi:LHFPL tetraspan subfamily member 2 protein [Contarinia nasturtii]|uniref:LHFPL tetraspan subfamily member 2 protein n=1 Tax=Contarinia nasturtii TaxID=265458 RepID=UPI0012D45C4F|nr:LHFPL tetraspan subfamily member 2 protein [Contarinia nasturtii]XP_031641048.1 LHFPL tetraspan subfamily member 2 protein [Contarinia nasturtii]XP_031641049.1 LHFPL tetraspan subfamily member 2 protein [Contarinia nasturtii]XP_031641050.1 LHFPL tetraspan subfamily member 2 protein [Contarinia nasturtii]XP_031641051.1 LHFPL tetraspan subfamily member 2 protein [Contarinia nasturtii]XP_031641052.1 LHFPL tetraspan subfamily member 2 protein [Contarinia nasturtii]